MKDNQYLLPLKLQFFAEGGDEGGDYEGDTNPDDSQIDNEGQDGDNGTQPDNTGKQTPTIPEGYMSKEDVSKLVSQRVNELNQKYSGAGRSQSAIERLAGLSGLTVDQFLERAEQLELQQRAQQTGISVEHLKELEEAKKISSEAKEQMLSMKYNMEEQDLLKNPLYADYDKYKDEVREFSQKNNLSLEQSMWALHGKELVMKNENQAEYRAQEKAKYKSQRGWVEGEGNNKSEPGAGMNLNPQQAAMAAKMGMSSDEYAIWNNPDLSFEDYQKLSKKQK